MSRSQPPPSAPPDTLDDLAALAVEVFQPYYAEPLPLAEGAGITRNVVDVLSLLGEWRGAACRVGGSWTGARCGGAPGGGLRQADAPASRPEVPAGAPMNDPDRVSLVSLFEGRRLDTVLTDNGPLWRCSQVGDLLDYPNRGRRLVTLVNNEWRSELRQGEHYVLAEASADVGAAPSAPPSSASPSLLLTLRGLDLVLLKTPTPVATRLRAFVDEQVLPQVPRMPPPSDAGARSRVVVVLFAPPGTPGEERVTSRAPGEQRPPTLGDVMRAFLGLPPESAPPDEEPCHTIPEIAEVAGVTEQTVARVVRRLGLRRTVAHSRAVLLRAPDGRLAYTLGFTGPGVRMILQALHENPPDGAA